MFGVLKIIDFAHGAFLTLGASAALVIARLGVSAWLACPRASRAEGRSGSPLNA
jgi:urea transport system permease protein